MAEEPEDRQRRREHGPRGAARVPRPAALATVPITRVLALPARVPLREHPDRSTVADIPFIALPVVSWSRATRGDALADLLGLVQRRGGRYVARHTRAVIDRTVPPDPREQSSSAAQLRLDVRITGLWTGGFVASAPVDDVHDQLRAVARCPILAFVPDEIVDRVIPADERQEPLTWLGLGRLLDDVLHTTTRS